MKQLLNWFRRGNLEHGLDRELRFHLESRATDLMRQGLTEPQARRQATLEIGGVTNIREEVRDVWLTRWMRDFVYDLRFSIRSFLRAPSFAATVILSLALGIGATTAIYSLVDQILLHSLPVRQPERLVLIDWHGEDVSSGFGSWNLMSYPICRDLEQQTRIFDGVFCRALTTLNLSTGSDPKPTTAEIVSGSYFAVLGVPAAIGRVLTENDDRTPGSSPVVVLAYDYWKTQFAGAPDVVGRKVLINQHPMTVVGVAAPNFHGVDVGEVPALWIPASMSADAIPGFSNMLDRRTVWMQVLGRLQDGLTLPRARAGIQPWFKAMLAEDVKDPAFAKITAERRKQFLESTLRLTPAPQGHSVLRRTLSQPLWVLFAATAVLLALGCLNVAGLFLARGSARARELSTRLALGASRGRIGRQLLADSILLALVGGSLGVALAPVAIQALVAFLPRDTAANALHSDIDSRLMLFALLVSVAAGVLTGLVPAFRAGRDSTASSLRERGGSSGGVGLRKLIVTVQIAFSLILLIGAISFVRTLTDLLAKGPGFQTSRLVSFTLDPRRNGYTSAQSSQLTRRIYDGIRSSPAFEMAALSREAVLRGGSWNSDMTIQADQRITTDRYVNLNAVSPDFFQTLGIRILAGRNFDEHDTRPPERYRSAIVNERFVKRYLAGRNPLAAHICMGSGVDAKPDIPIIGVVSDFNYRDLRDDSEQAFFPIFEGGDAGGTFYLRARVTPDEAFQSIRTVVQHADPALPIVSFRTVDEQVNRSLNTERLLATLSGIFGATALLLSLVGLYGVMSFVVTRRKREIGIRIALGASERSAIWLVIRDALAMIAAGVAIALPCIALLGQLIQSQLYGVKATAPSTVAQATLLLAAAVTAAAFLPGYRAARVNPIDALRVD